MSSNATTREQGYFMSTDEEMAVRGRMLTDYTAAKERLILLSQEAGRFSAGLLALGKLLAAPYSQQLALSTEHAELLDAGRIRRLIADLQETRAKSLELKQQLAAMGFNLT